MVRMAKIGKKHVFNRTSQRMHAPTWKRTVMHSYAGSRKRLAPLEGRQDAADTSNKLGQEVSGAKHKTGGRGGQER